jgi:sterol desaturase/sphingolipid hydroxylase (fatty acid hydroxylase superfamily)
MKNWEEALQQNIESGQSGDNGPDAQAYRAVFEALQKEPEYTLPPAFARQIMQKIEIRQKQRLSIREVRAVALAMFLMVAALGFTIYMTGVKPALGVLNGVKPYWGFIVFALSFIGLLHWLDRRFIIRKPTL